MVKTLISIAVALCLSSLFSCIQTQPQPAPRQEADMAALEKKLSETNEKLEKIYHRVSILQLMVDTQQRDIQDLKTTGGLSAPLESEPITEESLTDLTPIETISDPVARPAPVEPIVSPPENPTARAPMTPIVPDKKPPVADKPAPARSPDADALYQKAYRAYQAREYEAAAALFDTFTARYPDQDLADNALYWAGECRYTTKDFAGAIRIFKSVLKSYPNGNKVPDALLKTGFSYLSLGDKDNASSYLKKLIKNYPFSPAAAKAEDRLKQIKLN